VDGHVQAGASRDHSRLVVGKTVGISLFSWLAVRLGWAALPARVGWPHVLGVALIGGVGFTMSLFIAGLAFDGPLLASAKVGILLASATAAVLGGLVLGWRPEGRARAPSPSQHAPNLELC